MGPRRRNSEHQRVGPEYRLAAAFRVDPRRRVGRQDRHQALAGKLLSINAEHEDIAAVGNADGATAVFPRPFDGEVDGEQRRRDTETGVSIDANGRPQVSDDLGPCDRIDLARAQVLDEGEHVIHPLDADAAQIGLVMHLGLDLGDVFRRATGNQDPFHQLEERVRPHTSHGSIGGMGRVGYCRAHFWHLRLSEPKTLKILLPV